MFFWIYLALLSLATTVLITVQGGAVWIGFVNIVTGSLCALMADLARRRDRGGEQ